MRRLLAALLLATIGPATVSVAQNLPYGQTLSFVVQRNGEPIGRHTVGFQHNGPDLTVSTAIDFAVKVLGFTAYRYTHRAQETWSADAFRSLVAQTDDNGKKYAVRAERNGSGIDVERNAERALLPADLLPTSHWNFRQVDQSALLNTQNGTQARVQITPIGRERVRTATGWVDAMRYRYAGDVDKDQWFDDRGRWVKTSFKGSDGSSIEYILQE
jgi:hypothetical protein